MSVTAMQQASFLVKLLKWDIICGDPRFGSHTGNIKFQQILSKMRSSYTSMESKTAKKKLIKDVDEFIQSYGGRFLRVDQASASLRIMTTAEARNKISRSLRENVSPQKGQKAFIAKISELDVICGRGKQ
jgi:KaiC/GvpD/RAD55 family RecA-like ATPase